MSTLFCHTATSGTLLYIIYILVFHLGLPLANSMANALRRLMIAEVPTLGA